MARFWRVSSVLVVVLLVLTIVTPIVTSETASAATTGNSTNKSITIYFFYGDTCPHCAIVEPLINSLAAKYPQTNFIKLEVFHNSANKALFLDFLSRYGVKSTEVPAVFIAGRALIAENAIQSNLESIIRSLINSNNTTSLPIANSAQSASVIAPAKTIPKAPTVIKTSLPGTKSNNSTTSAKTVGATKSVPEASTVNEIASPKMEFSTSNGAIFNSSQVAIQWNYTSGLSNVATAKVAIDGGSFNSIARDAKSYVASGLADGNHAFVLRITDGNGSSSDHGLNFTVELGHRSSSNSAISSPMLIGFVVFILIVGISLVLVQRMRRKV